MKSLLLIITILTIAKLIKEYNKEEQQ